MKIRARIIGEAVFCELADGREIEVTIVDAIGEDIYFQTDIQQVLALIEENRHLFSS